MKKGTTTNARAAKVIRQADRRKPAVRNRVNAAKTSNSSSTKAARPRVVRQSDRARAPRAKADLPALSEVRASLPEATTSRADKQSQVKLAIFAFFALALFAIIAWQVAAAVAVGYVWGVINHG